MILSKNIRAFYTVTITVMVNVCIVWNLSFGALHFYSPEHHHFISEPCSADKENDACHRFLVHHEKSNSCDGSHDHFNSKPEECFSCKYLKHRCDVINAETDSPVIYSNFSINYYRIYLNDDNQKHLGSYLRGPPAV